MDAHQNLRDAFGRFLNRTTPHSGACPDCDADLTMREDSPGVFLTVVSHDSTCPTLHEIERKRTR